MDEIVEVTVPSVAQEAARDLVRARGDARGDLMRCRHRLSKLLLRQGIVYSGGTAWTGAHDMWLRSQKFDQSALQATFDSNYEAMLLTRSRRDRLDAAIEVMAENSPYTPTVHRLGCLRGISTLTGFGLAAWIGDWQRFTGSTIGSYVGLVPSEYSSGTTRSQGSITKTGNGHARRLLVEAPLASPQDLPQSRAGDAHPVGESVTGSARSWSRKAITACIIGGSSSPLVRSVR